MSEIYIGSKVRVIESDLSNCVDADGRPMDVDIGKTGTVITRDSYGYLVDFGQELYTPRGDRYTHNGGMLDAPTARWYSYGMIRLADEKKEEDCMEYKVGDIVRIVKSVEQGDLDKAGTVVYADYTDGRYGVDFGTVLYNGGGARITHKLGGLLSGDTGRWYLDRHIELVETAAEEPEFDAGAADEMFVLMAEV